ncbi:Peptidyl-prolyl cis-trans isomerase fpr2, partial [Massospora cicadina]
MRFSIALSLLSLLIAALKKEPTNLQIGIKKRIPDKDCPRKAAPGDTVKVHYVGTLFSTGEEFDSSRSRDSPFEFKLDSGMVIK